MSLRDSAIVAYAETKVVERSEEDVWVLGAHILESLLDKTGFDKAEIDGLLVAGLTLTGAGNPFWAQTTADQLGLELDYIEQVHVGGCSAAGSVARAAAAIDAGLCTTALLLFADTGVRENNMRDRSYRREWTEPCGLMGPPGAFGLLSRRYESQYGLDYRMLGKLAVTQRDHAVMNENACEKLRKPITIDDYLGSRMIADPIRLLDCVMPADGAAGLIMTSTARAKQKGLSKCVIPIGYGERTNYNAAGSLADPALSGHQAAGQKAFAQAGLDVKDVASFHPYDDFIIAIMLQFENLGFCKLGQGCDFIRDHDLSFRGELPLNTGGGQISAGQAACSSHNLIEAVRQLMGEGGERQIANTKNALVTGIGWINYARNWGSSAALVLVPELIEARTTMSTPLNDTLSLKREIKTFGFSQPYWDGSRQQKLVIQYCKATKKYQHFPRPTSIYTGRRRDIEWREVSGKGEVFSWTITHRGTAGFRSVEPYAIVCVTLDVGVNVVANMVSCTAEELRVGMKVMPHWMPLDDGTHLLMFQPERAAA